MKNIQEYEKNLESLCRKLGRLKFSDPVHMVYNPLDYARKSHLSYMEQYFFNSPKKIIFLGMNPGPFGMAQTGVPFGEISLVKNWMKVSEEVRQPKVVHPKRPIEGFECTRSEVSGRRLWGFFKDRFGSANKFFKKHFVWNYCPLAFLSQTGANVTPDKIKAAEMLKLGKLCDEFLVEVIESSSAHTLVGIGAYAEKALKRLFSENDYRVVKVLHPSPASPAANRGWAEAASRQLEEASVLKAAPKRKKLPSLQAN